METYFQLFTLSSAIGGPAASCPMLLAIQAAAQNASYTETECAQLQQFHDKVVANWNITDVDTRLQILMNITMSFSEMESWFIPILYPISFEYTVGGITVQTTCYQVFFLAYFKFLYGFTCDLGALSCQSPNGNATVTPADGNSTSSTNYCPLVAAWNAALPTFSLSCQNALKPVVMRCNNYDHQCFNNGTKWNGTATTIVNYIKTNPTNNVQCQFDLVSTYITVNGFIFGRFCDFAACLGFNTTALAC